MPPGFGPLKADASRRSEGGSCWTPPSRPAGSTVPGPFSSSSSPSPCWPRCGALPARRDGPANRAVRPVMTIEAGRAAASSTDDWPSGLPHGPADQRLHPAGPPHEAPPTEKTDVWVMYDGRTSTSPRGAGTRRRQGLVRERDAPRCDPARSERHLRRPARHVPRSPATACSSLPMRSARSAISRSQKSGTPTATGIRCGT